MSLQSNTIEIVPLTAVAVSFRLDPKSTQAALASAGVVPVAYSAMNGEPLFEVGSVFRAMPRAYSQPSWPHPSGACTARGLRHDQDRDDSWSGHAIAESSSDEDFELEDRHEDGADPGRDEFEDGEEEFEDGEEEFEDEDEGGEEEFEDGEEEFEDGEEEFEDEDEGDTLDCDENHSESVW